MSEQAVPPEMMEYVDRLAAFFRQDSHLPPNVARILAYMLTCTPEMQSAEQIARSLQISSGSVSTAVNMLEQAGLLKRFIAKGDRRHYYAANPDGWRAALELRLRSVQKAIQLADEGLGIAEGNERLQAMRRVYTVFDGQVDELIAKLNQQ